MGTTGPGAALLHDPSTYLSGPPLDALARLRRELLCRATGTGHDVAAVGVHFPSALREQFRAQRIGTGQGGPSH